LRHREPEEERTQERKQVRSQVWCVKQKTNETAPSASINMVFILPMEFKAPTDDEEAEEQAMAELTLDPMPATFDKPKEKEHRHLRPLYIKGHVDGRPMTKMLVNGGAAVNVMPYTTYRKLGKGKEDLIKTNMMLKDFEGKASPAQGAINVELMIGSKTLLTTFFIINGKNSYNLLLDRDWIHANCCIPSTMHQYLIEWLKDTIEIIYADSFAQCCDSRSSGVGV
jgi:hypothetical protein